MNEDITNTNCNGYLYLDPSPPTRADSRFTLSCNPHYYTQRWEIPLKQGELLQQVYVKTKGTPRFWSDRRIEQIEDCFPTHLPLKDLVFGIENNNVQITVKGKIFNFRYKQKKEKFGHHPFETTMEEYHLKQISLYPEQEAGECYVTNQVFNGQNYKAVVKRLNNQESLGEITSECIYQLFLDSNKKIVKADNTLLKKMYKKKKFLGGGGEGVVYKVLKKDNGTSKALKIALSSSYPKEVITIVSYLLSTNQTPHLTRVDRILLVPTTSNPLEVFNVKKDDFVKGQSAEKDEFSFKNKEFYKDRREYLRTGIEMELLDGDIEKLYLQMDPIKQSAIMLQACSAIKKLNQFCITVCDFKTRNIFYKKLEDQTFKGKRLADYDYWKYTIEGNDFYIPRMDILIKLGDYDQWTTTLFTDHPSVSAGSAFYSAKKLSGLKVMFPPPADSNARILDMN